MWGYQCGTLNCCARFCARCGFMSQTLTTSTKGLFVSTGRYWPETLPQPITAVRIFFGGGSAANSFPDAAAAPASNVVLVKSRRVIELVFILARPHYYRSDRVEG